MVRQTHGDDPSGHARLTVMTRRSRQTHGDDPQVTPDSIVILSGRWLSPAGQLEPAREKFLSQIKIAREKK